MADRIGHGELGEDDEEARPSFRVASLGPTSGWLLSPFAILVCLKALMKPPRLWPVIGLIMNAPAVCLHWLAIDMVLVGDESTGWQSSDRKYYWVFIGLVVTLNLAACLVVYLAHMNKATSETASRRDS